MRSTDKVIVRIIGKPKKKGRDFDGDGVVDGKDCQPRNVMRQDVLKYGSQALRAWANKKVI